MKPSNLMNPPISGSKKARKRQKYNAKGTRVGGIYFASKKEAERFLELCLQRKAGEISHFHRQVTFDLPGGVTYKCDFQIVHNDGHITYEDVKGSKHTKAYADFIRNKKMVEALYPVIIEEV